MDYSKRAGQVKTKLNVWFGSIQSNNSSYRETPLIIVVFSLHVSESVAPYPDIWERKRQTLSLTKIALIIDAITLRSVCVYLLVSRYKGLEIK